MEPKLFNIDQRVKNVNSFGIYFIWDQRVENVNLFGIYKASNLVRS